MPREKRPRQDPEGLAREVILRQLTSGPRTRGQLALALARREVPLPVAEAALDRFTEIGYIDDTAYASAWVRSRSSAKGLGGRALSRELQTRGVAPELISTALAKLAPEDERAGAQSLAARRARSMANLEHPVALRRLVGMLIRKGHPPGLAYAVAREALAVHGAAGAGEGDDGSVVFDGEAGASA